MTTKETKANIDEETNVDMAVENSDKTPTNHGHTGKNILTSSKRVTPEEQREHVSKQINQPGRITHLENKVVQNTQSINQINGNITKMMFIIVVLSVAMVAFKVGSAVQIGVSYQSIIEILIGLLLSYFGVKSTYEYTKEHPENGNATQQLYEAGKQIVESVTMSGTSKKGG